MRLWEQTFGWKRECGSIVCPSVYQHATSCTIHESTLEPRRRTRLLVSRDAVHHSPLSEPSGFYNVLEVKSAKVSVSSLTHVVL